MEFSKIYTRLIEKWPLEISLLDAQTPKESGQYFPTLSAVYHKIEDEIDFVNDHWSNIGQWAIYQTFHAEAREHYKKNLCRLLTRQVSLNGISLQLEKNLKSSDWSFLRTTFLPFPN